MSSTNAVRILDHNGHPMQFRPSRASMLAGGGGGTPYDAASMVGEHMGEWQPFLWSPDAELNVYRNRIVSRMRDVVRNDGWASGIVTRIVDNAVGGNFHPVPKPDFRALQAYTGLKTFDVHWAAEFAGALKAFYRTWANEPGRYCDLSRRQVMAQILPLAFRHKMIDGDALAMLHWKPERLGSGRARYATAIQLIDPDRLSNPQMLYDQRHLRGGVEVDEDDVAIAYHIRKAHQGDWWAGADSVTWERIPRETDWGRPIIVHDFDTDRGGRHRGGVGVLGPVMTRLKMLFKYDTAELDAALVNAIFGAFVESPFDHSLLGDALSDGQSLGPYQDGRKEFHEDRRYSVGGVRISTLYPGEKLNFARSERPNGNFAMFEKAVLRNAASAAGVSAQQASNDWSDVNYSSARAALLEYWKTNTRRRQDFATGFCQQILAAFVEECMAVDDLPLPTGAPPFEECRGEYARATWMGPALGWLDPVDEPAGAILRMDGALSTLSREHAEQGLDTEEVLDERALELKMFEDRGMTAPSWATMAVPAREAAKKPEAE